VRALVGAGLPVKSPLLKKNRASWKTSLMVLNSQQIVRVLRKERKRINFSSVLRATQPSGVKKGRDNWKRTAQAGVCSNCSQSTRFLLVIDRSFRGIHKTPLLMGDLRVF